MTYKYYCPRCTTYLYGSTTFDVAVQVNRHNRAKHPFEKDDWDAEDIRHSSNFEVADDITPSYLVKPATPDPNELPKLTDGDKRLLRSLRVSWPEYDVSKLKNYTLVESPHTVLIPSISKRPLPVFISEQELAWLKEGKIKWDS